MLGEWPWRRRHIADIIRLLDELGAQCIVIDLVFATQGKAEIDLPDVAGRISNEKQIVVAELGPDNVRDDDAELTDAIGAAGNVVLASYFLRSDQPGWLVRKLLSEQPDLDEQQVAFNTKCVGRTLPVLFDRRGKRTGQLVGRSPYLQAVHAQADPKALGRILPVEISSFGPNSLAGVIRSA